MEKQQEIAQENKEREGSHKKAFLIWAILAGLGSGFLRDTLGSNKEQQVGEKIKSTGVFEISG